MDDVVGMVKGIDYKEGGRILSSDVKCALDECRGSGVVDFKFVLVH